MASPALAILQLGIKEPGGVNSHFQPPGLTFPRHAAQTASERQATTQWKSTRERGAETPKKEEMRNGSSAIQHFERGDEDVME